MRVVQGLETQFFEAIRTGGDHRTRDAEATMHWFSNIDRLLVTYINVLLCVALWDLRISLVQCADDGGLRRKLRSRSRPIAPVSVCKLTSLRLSARRSLTCTYIGFRSSGYFGSWAVERCVLPLRLGRQCSPTTSCLQSRMLIASEFPSIANLVEGRLFGVVCLPGSE